MSQEFIHYDPAENELMNEEYPIVGDHLVNEEGVYLVSGWSSDGENHRVELIKILDAIDE